MKIKFLPIISIAGVLLLASRAFASGELQYASIVGVDTLLVLFSAFLVFVMQAGFGMLESGLIRPKNTVDILMKNFLDFCIASIGFFIFGYAIAFGTGTPFMGYSGWLLIGASSEGLPLYAEWFFHAVFCGVAATIVAGAVAGRMKFKAYLMYSFLMSALVYPFAVRWVWGGGWLDALGFTDFAGSTVVHAVGGVAGFAGAIAIGPRIGRYNKDGSPNAIPGHSMPLAALGTLILWFAWFGFNVGSTLEVGDGSQMAHVAITTNLAAVSGALTAMFLAWKKFGKPDLSLTMNGVLAGLVSITAPCAFVTPLEAILIGALGGVIMLFGVSFLDRLRIDDPVGAFPVHGLCGIWGTLAVGLFGRSTLGLARDGLLHGGGFAQFGVQALGTFTICAAVFVLMLGIFKAIGMVLGGIRVSREEELKGLDISLFGQEAYSGFQIFSTQ